MTVKRLILLMLIPVISLLLWSLPAFAAETCGEGCKMTDDWKKMLANEGYTALYDARNTYGQYVNILRREYEAEGGSCHNLYSDWDHDALVSLFSGGLEGANELHWTDADIKGGQEIDSGKYVKKSLKCIDMMNVISDVGVNAAQNIKDTKSKKTYQDYTDWDINKMIKMAGSSNTKINEVAKWIANATPGSYMKVDGDAKKSICQKVACTSNITSNSCDYMFKEENGSIACVDSYALRLPRSDGKCYSVNIPQKQVRCYEEKRVATRFGSADEFKSKMIQGDAGTQKCIAELNKAASLRGNTTSGSGFIGKRIKAHQALAALGGADTQCCCELDENGNMTDKITHCDVNDADFVDENLDETCKTAAQYQAEMGELCLTCGLMAKILGGVQKISKNAFEAINGDLINLLEVALLIYIAYLVLMTVASPEAQKLSQFLTQLLHQGAKVTIAVLILTYPEALYDKVINPILEGGVDFGLAFSNIKANSNELGTMDVAIGEKIRTEGAEYSKDFDMSSKYLHGDTLQKMVGANKNFSREAAMMPALGRCLICNSLHNLGAKRLWFIPRVSMLITGVILLVFGVMIWLAIGFYILDCCLQLGIVVAMMSFFVACWPFKITSSYVRVGWNMFLNTFFNFIMMSVVVVTIAQLTAAALPEDLMQDINEDNVEMINDQLEIIGLSVIILVITCLICLKLSAEAGRLANKFAGGAQVKMGADLGGLAGDMATKGAKAGLKTGGKAVAGAVSSASEASGATGAIQAKGQAIKEKLGGGTKSQSASFKPDEQNQKDDKQKDDKKDNPKPDGNK